MEHLMEKNKHILDKALQNLGSFTPKDGVWVNIDGQLKRQFFEDNLNQLPNYNPPDSIWDTISQKLSKDEKLKQLKSFTPEDSIWASIDESLTASEKQFSKTRITRITSWLTAAAAVLLLSYFIIFPGNEKSNISYSEEVVMQTETKTWAEDDTNYIEILHELCASNPVACNAPEFKAKELELDYLDERKTEILKQMNGWDENTNLQVMLTRIELEKSEIVKQMIAEIL